MTLPACLHVLTEAADGGTLMFACLRKLVNKRLVQWRHVGQPFGSKQFHRAPYNGLTELFRLWAGSRAHRHLLMRRLDPIEVLQQQHSIMLAGAGDLPRILLFAVSFDPADYVDQGMNPGRDHVRLGAFPECLFGRARHRRKGRKAVAAAGAEKIVNQPLQRH